MSSTTTNYLSKIKQNFPVRGQDNDSQGFRDNFHNIHEAIKYVNDQVDVLDKVSVKTDQTSTFYGNTIENANFKNCSTEVWQNSTTELNDIIVDYHLGSYQVLSVSAGSHNIDIKNWPGAGKSGNIKLSITPASDSPTYIAFPDTYVVLGPETNPYMLTSGMANVFEVFSELAINSSQSNYYVKQLNTQVLSTGTSTHSILVDELRIKKNTYTTNTNFATVVTSAPNGYRADLAIVPDKQTLTITDYTYNSNPQYTILTFVDASGVLPGATVYNPNTSAVYTVSTLDDNQHVRFSGQQLDPALYGAGTSLIFVNPVPPAQPVVATMAATPANSDTGLYTNFKGSIYASANRLEITYGSYGSGVKNTFTATTLAVVTPTDNSLNLANTRFVHQVLPYGSIMMWYGISSTVPTGWHICDGTNGTPDLRDRFIVGASADYPPPGSIVNQPATTISGSTTTLGGTSATTLVSHMHVGTFVGTTTEHTHAITDPGHHHASQYDNRTPGSIDTTGAGSEIGGIGNIWNYPTTDATTGITIAPSQSLKVSGTITANSTGTADTSHTNIPPFRAIYFIMKTTGQ